jgi:hypothetical protein
MSDLAQIPESDSDHQSTGANCGREAGARYRCSWRAKRLPGQAHFVVKQSTVIERRVFEKFGAATPNAEEFSDLRVWSLRADTMQTLAQGEHHRASDTFPGFLS